MLEGVKDEELDGLDITEYLLMFRNYLSDVWDPFAKWGIACSLFFLSGKRSSRVSGIRSFVEARPAGFFAFDFE